MWCCARDVSAARASALERLAVWHQLHHQRTLGERVTGLEPGLHESPTVGCTGTIYRPCTAWSCGHFRNRRAHPTLPRASTGFGRCVRRRRRGRTERVSFSRPARASPCASRRLRQHVQARNLQPASARVRSGVGAPPREHLPLLRRRRDFRSFHSRPRARVRRTWRRTSPRAVGLTSGASSVRMVSATPHEGATRCGSARSESNGGLRTRGHLVCRSLRENARRESHSLLWHAPGRFPGACRRIPGNASCVACV